MKDTKKPKIRFKEFNDSWEQRKLSDMAIFNPKAELPDVFEYVDLESVVGTEMLSHRTESKRTAPSRAQRLAQKGDLFYQTVRPYQKNNYLFENPEKHYVFSTGYAQMRPIVDGRFLLCLVQNDGFVKDVLDNCTGTSYPAINSNDLAEIEVYSPSDPQEQRQIGDFFKKIDSLITLHQRECEKLLCFKKSMLEKMFPKNGEKYPEIRFSGFTDSWEQRKLGSIADRVTEKNALLEVSETFTNSAEFGIISQRDFFDHDITNKENIGNYFIVRPEDFVYNPRISVTAPVGPINRNKLGRNGVMSPLYTVFRPHDVSNTYLEYFFKTSRWYAFMQFNGDSGARSDRFSIGTDLFYEMPIPAPSFNEQEKIGSFFANLSDLITLHQREIKVQKRIKLWRII